ncbi:MAG: FkbM family methyltransferase [Haliscomenobacter sp.]
MHTFHTALHQLEQFARGNRWKRFFRAPLRYLFAVGFRYLVYPFTQRGILLQSATFFGKPMHLVLPAGTDIFLAGGKTHDSEIRLARFLSLHLQPGDRFLDIGAHYGYFTLLAASLVGEHGAVLAFEPALSTFQILEKNTKAYPAIRIFNYAVSDLAAPVTFYEFPVLYSEYNAMDTQPYLETRWFRRYAPQPRTVQAVVLDAFQETAHFRPAIVKLDVEGAEDKVLSGYLNTLRAGDAPFVVMEYLPEKNGEGPHRRAWQLLESLGYRVFRIDASGQLLPLSDINAYFASAAIDSDNLVFSKFFGPLT